MTKQKLMLVHKKDTCSSLKKTSYLNQNNISEALVSKQTSSIDRLYR